MTEPRNPSSARPLRCLIAWELGSNFGHLVRCVALAKGLREQGHAVVFAVRDLRSAEQLLGPEGFTYVQAPLLMPATNPQPALPVNYADLLLRCGWRDGLALAGSVQGWLHLFRLARPDLLIADHAPTALLAAHIAALPTAAIGHGFEIPPAQSPLPAFRPDKLTDSTRVERADAEALQQLNKVVQKHRRPPFTRVAELFDRAHIVLATFAELDHYGRRPDQGYAGVFYSYDKGVSVTWSQGGGPRVIAYLRVGNPGARNMLAVLRKSDCRCLAIIPDAEPAFVAEYQSETLQLHTRPVALAPLLPQADLAIGYGSMGFTVQTLRAGMPQLILPEVIEQALFARRVGALGAGILLAGEKRRETDCMRALQSILQTQRYSLAARAFATQYSHYGEEGAARDIVERLVNWV